MSDACGAVIADRNGSSLVMTDDWGIPGVTRMSQPQSKRTSTLSDWSAFKTVCWRKDAQKDFEFNQSTFKDCNSKFKQKMPDINAYLIAGIIGALTATSGALIEKLVDLWADLRFGYCTNFYLHPYMYALKKDCESEGTWYEWPNQYLYFVIFSTLVATVSAILTWAFAPMSKGSGIPEIKMILGGFTFPEVLSGNTLFIKIIGLSMSVGAGLACGKEGPLVHIACCWGNLVSKCFARYRDNQANQRDLLSCACAAGVAVAFGAPLGGVLFSLEEASTLFPTKTMLRAFFAGAVAALTLGLWDPEGTGKLTMFEAEYKSPVILVEYPIIIVLGIVGGLIGAAFVHFNIVVSKNRGPGTWFRKKCHIVLEVLLISLFTAITSYHLIWTRVLSGQTIKAVFHDCLRPTTETPAGSSTYMDVCVFDGNNGTPNLDTSLMLGLLVSGFLRWFQMIFTFGTGCAAGLFIPSLYVGGALGRIVGILVARLNHDVGFAEAIFPGVYAMLGAAAVLGGVCRVTISLVVIMFELTGGLQLIVPFMIVCMLAKWVGDAFTLGIYDYIIVIRKYPFLHEPDELAFNTFAKDVMDEGICTLHPQLGTVDGVLSFLRRAKYGGFPLTLSPTDSTVVGYVRISELLAHIEGDVKNNVLIVGSTKVEFSKFCDQKDPQAMDVSPLVDEAIMQCSPETPVSQLQSVFRNVGVRVILVKHRAALVGMITKKSFISHLDKQLTVRSGTVRKKEGLQETLLPAP